jgi:hypothetical protein
MLGCAEPYKDRREFTPIRTEVQSGKSIGIPLCGPQATAAPHLGLVPETTTMKLLAL